MGFVIFLVYLRVIINFADCSGFEHLFFFLRSNLLMCKEALVIFLK